jgi:hypothetical protein
VIAAATLTQIGSDPFTVVIVALVTFLAGRKVANHMAKVERDPRLVKILTWSLVLHLLCAPAEIWVVDHIYGGVADFNRYMFQGAYLSENIRAGQFTLAGTGIMKVEGDGMASIISGVVLTFVGPNKLAEFLVFAFLSFVGHVAFYRAFSITFPEANRRRYLYLIMFLPSLLFWTADVSKEAIMTFALGICALGVARVLVHAPRGYVWLLLGGTLGILVRPHEVALLAVGFAVAIIFRKRDPSLKMRGIRRIFSFIFVAVILVITDRVTEKYLGNPSSLTKLLNNVHYDNNTGAGAGFGSSSVSYSSNPLAYPKDVYSILFDPLPITAHSKSEYVAAFENTLILVLILISMRQLRAVIRTAWCFLYVFASLGNLGLIDRERTLLLPFFLVLLCIPLSPKGQPKKYPWERVNRHRKKRRLSLQTRVASRV